MINSENGSLWAKVRLDTDQLNKDAKSAEKMFTNLSKGVTEEGNKMDSVFDGLGKKVAGFLTATAAAGIVKKVATVRGEMQQLEIAYTTMLGSATKSNKLLAESVELAAKTPFGLQDVAQGAKQLLAYGSEAEEVTSELTMLGDIAAGLSIPLNDIVYLYGTTRTQGRMYTLDLRQFMGRGIPLAEELAKQFGVTKDKVGELVTEGKVGFEDMRKALQSMTSDGSLFGGLMEKQSKSITGQISNLEDSVYQMFNEIGEKSEGVISDSLKGVSYIIENYEKVGKVLLDIAAAYGSYKAAVVAVNVATQIGTTLSKGWTIAELAHYKALVLLETAQKKFNLAALKNPYVLVGVAVGALTFGIYKLITAESESEKYAKRLAKSHEELSGKIEERKQKTNELIDVINDETKTEYAREIALAELHKLAPEYIDDLKKQASGLKDVRIEQEKLNLEATKHSQKEVTKQQEHLLKLKGTNSISALSEEDKKWLKWSGINLDDVEKRRKKGYAWALQDAIDSKIEENRLKLINYVDEVDKAMSEYRNSRVEEPKTPPTTTPDADKSSKSKKPENVFSQMMTEAKADLDNAGAEAKKLDVSTISDELGRKLAEIDAEAEAKRVSLRGEHLKKLLEITENFNAGKLTKEQKRLLVTTENGRYMQELANNGKNSKQKKDEAKELDAEQNRLKSLKEQLATVKNLTTWERSKLEAKKQELAASLELAKTDDERDSTSEKIKEIECAITSLDEAQMRLDEVWGGNGIEEFVDNLKTMITLTKKQNSEVGLTVDETNDLIDRESSLKASVISVVESFSEFSNLISDLAEGGKMENFASGMSEVADVLSNTVKGFAQGGAIGGVISFLGTTLGKFAQMGKEAKKAKEEYLQKQNDYQKSLYESSISYENYQSNSIFGSNALLSYKEASRALADYKKQLNNIQTQWYDFNNQKMDYSTALADYINPDGTVDENSVMQLEQKISTLSDGSEARKYFEQIQSLLTEYGTAVEEENKAIVSMFQNSGTEISDSIVSAFDNGTNAMEAFGSSTGDIMNNVKRTILKNLIETDWYSEIESKASNLIEAYQSESTTDDAIAESEWDIANKSFSESISKYQEMYSRLGITSEGGTASTYSKGIAQASQDTVDELNGRMTVIQAHTGIISANTQSILQSNQAMLNELQLIQNNTAQLHQMRLDIAKLSDCVVNRTIKTTLN